MRIEFHVQPEQFEYIGFEYDTKEELTDEAIQAAIGDYRRAKGQIEAIEGLPSKEFNAALDEFLVTNNLTNGADLYARMSPAQQQCFQEVKRSLKRLSARELKASQE